MSKPLVMSISSSATKLVDFCEMRGTGAVLDYSRASLTIVEEMAEEASQWNSKLSTHGLTKLAQSIGCYLFEVARREFRGDFRWHNSRDQPVLVVGEPVYHVALMTWDKARGRLTGDRADNLPFFYDGFVERTRHAAPGTRVLYG